MKKILFATTALVMTAGMASAEISWSGKAEVSVTDTSTTAATMNNGVDINLSASTTTDGGMSISWSNDIGNGCIVDLADKECDAQNPDIGAGKLTLGFSGITAVLGTEGADDLYDDDRAGDVSLAGAAGSIKYAVTADVNDNKASWSIAWAEGAISVSAAGSTDWSAAKGTVSYKVGDTTLSVTSDNKGAAATKTTGKVAQSLGDLSLAVEAARQGSANTWKISGGYKMGAISTAVQFDNANAWELDVTYGLGGGANAFFGADNKNTVLAGLNFSF